MKRIASKIRIHRKKGTRNTHVAHNDIDRTMLQIILWSFGALAFVYIFFLGNMVFDIVERRSLESDSRTLGNEVGNLELTYLAMANEIDLDLSYSLGFREVEATFATRKPLSSIRFRSFDSIRTAQNGI